MDRNPRSLIVLAVAVALAVPVAAAAQAIPRTTGSSGSSGSSGSTTSSGSSSSSAGEQGSSRSLPPLVARGSRTPSSSSSRVGSSTSRSGSNAGSASSGRSGGNATSSGSRGTFGSSSGSAASRTYGSRDRGDRALIGSAKERPERLYGYGNDNIGLYYPGNPFSPWGRWYPWYAGGFGYGYVSFDPWRSGNSRYSLWRYGSWYNPYEPCYGGGYSLCGPSFGGGGGGGDYDDDGETGSVRLRVSPSSAEVYVDGELAGIVDDFNGLSDHLQLTSGEHLVEIRAQGYETFLPEIDVALGKTTTVRGSMKKVKR